jgi:solute carrier family 20 (sodium-dependent phosphate transporter)
VLGVAFGVVALYAIFLLPFLHRRLVQDDWTLKSWEVLHGPLLWRRGPVPPRPEGFTKDVVQDYYRGHSNSSQMPQALTHNADIDARDVPVARDAEKNIPSDAVTPHTEVSSTSSQSAQKPHNPLPKGAKSLSQIDGAWYRPTNLFLRAKYYFFHGVNVDVVASQLDTNRPSRTAWLISPTAMKHAQQADLHYDNKTEHLYSFLQVLTCAVASFAHGSNDVSNAVGPLSAIFLIWRTSELSSKSPVPVWLLAYGGAAIVIGLWTYGYNIMRNLGNRLTLHSPSRGFSMELGSATTVILATRLGLPISTTQCIIGATVGVGLSSGSWRAVNWRMVAWSYLGWIVTLPVAGIVAGCLMGIIINAPEWSGAPAVLRMKL